MQVRFSPPSIPPLTCPPLTRSVSTATVVRLTRHGAHRTHPALETLSFSPSSRHGRRQFQFDELELILKPPRSRAITPHASRAASSAYPPDVGRGFRALRRGASPHLRKTSAPERRRRGPLGPVTARGDGAGCRSAAPLHRACGPPNRRGRPPASGQHLMWRRGSARSPTGPGWAR